MKQKWWRKQALRFSEQLGQWRDEWYKERAKCDALEARIAELEAELAMCNHAVRCPCETIKSFKRMMELVRCFRTKHRVVVPKPEHWRKGE